MSTIAWLIYQKRQKRNKIYNFALDLLIINIKILIMVKWLVLCAFISMY